ncbi:S9 family peptidase [Sphingobacterium sp. JB170]|uniref:S9 family peptidase n=1 Tax=Sphingobacterium sp. JB170 TaxID=1434842 RepID=UPI00097EBCD3|nr:S9 family peptidase [Sphingobacterium sp. JB170]SJN30301.1 putative peptidase [Sphingobacterium sp. JB170]
MNYNQIQGMIKHFHWAFIILICCILASCQSKQEVNDLIPIEDFFSKPERSNFRISPDGSKIAYLGIDAHCRNIFVLDLKDDQQSKQLTYQSDMNVQYFYWVSDSTIVFSNRHSPNDSLRIHAISVKSEKSIPLLPTMKGRLRWVKPQRSFDDYLLAAMNDRDSSVFDLYKIALDGSGRELISRNPGNIANWYSSADGKVRLAITSDSVQENLLYRGQENQPFKTVATTDYLTLIRPLGFVKNSLTNVVALSNQNRDKFALVEFNIATGNEDSLLYVNSEVDLDPDGYSDRTQQPLFAQYTKDKTHKHFFNKDVERDFLALSKSFQGQTIDIIDSDTSLNHWLVNVYTDVHAGGIYYYDVERDSAKLLVEANPMLASSRLSSKESIAFQSRDGLTLNGYLTYPAGKVKKNLPVVVLVHDGPYRRERSDFDAEVQFLANRGYLVFQLNYRGSSGYGKQFWTAGFKEWGGKIQADIIDGVTWLIHQGVVDKDRVAIMGSGFGGYSALHAATYNSSFYKCAISMSGYTNLFTYFKGIPPHLKKYVSLFYNIIGDPDKEYEMFKAMSPVFHADKVKIPILFAQGGEDQFSSLTDANQFVQKVMKNNVPIKYIYKEEEGRQFRSDENVINYYQEVELFLKKYL